MSEWIKIKDQDDVEMSEDGTEIEVYFESDYSGNRYIEIPLEYIIKVLEDNFYKVEYD